MMLGYEKLKRVILRTNDPTERKILFLALLTAALPKGETRKRRPILTGGSAIEVYLDGTLRSGDMDIVYKVSELKRILKVWRFELGPALRSYANDELGLAVDLVGDELSGSYDKVTTIITDQGPATVIGVEDLILKRLVSVKFWDVRTDMEQCYLLAKSQGAKIDWNYLEERAKKQDVADYLGDLKAMLSKRGKRPR